MAFNSRLTNINGRSGPLQTTEGIKYIYDLPFFDRKELCRIFDENNQWETLGGGLMGYSSSELAEFGRAVYRGASPTEALLTSWGNQNHTLLELFTLCARLYHARAMKVLAKYVDPKYHTYIRDPDFNATQELVGIDPPQPLLGVQAELKAQNNVQKNEPVKKADAQDAKKDEAKDNAKKAALASLSESVGLLPQIPYTDLTTATNGWDRRNMLGKGGFGTVYKGMWKNTAVAIKRMEQHRTNEAYVESQMKQSLGEMKFLNSYRHDNILPLYGFSLEGQYPCLIYQFMTNGSLEDRILCRQKTHPLSWHLRLHIAKGVACGIQFLHSIGPQPLIHGDIKSANILLDRNFEAKVGDFGLAREMLTPSGSASNASYVKVSRVHGTRPYLPDEYLRSKKLSTKVDTYSFGIVLFELASGLRAYEEQRHKKFLKDMVEEFDGIMDKLKDIKGGLDNPDVFFTFINLGRICTERLAKKRPEMVEVMKALETSLTTQISSIRTQSTHVTGLPYLFELPQSRPGSLGIPVSSYTTNRNSPEMRAGSPHWIQQQPHHQGPFPHNTTGIRDQISGLPSPSIPSPGGVRKVSSQTSPPLIGPPQQQHISPSPLPPPTHFEPTQVNHPPLHQSNVVAPLNLNILPNVPQNSSPPRVPQNIPHDSNSNNTSTTSNQNNPLALPLTIDTGSGSRPPPPELIVIQPSPTPLLSLENTPIILPLLCEPIVEQDDEMYLPLVLEHNTDPSSLAFLQDDAGPTTVIPLITELGIKE